MSTMMMDMSIAGKIKTFFNKFVTQAKRDKTFVSITAHQNEIIHSCIFDSLRVTATCNFTAVQDYSPVIVNFNEWLERISKEKEKEVQYMPLHLMNDEYRLAIGAEQLNATTENEAHYIWEEIASCEPKPVADGIAITNTLVSNGLMGYNNKVFFSIKDGELKMLNTNDVMLNQVTIDGMNHTEEFVFSIANSYISKMKTFFAYVSKNTKMTISVCENMIQFKCHNKAFDVELVCPFERTDETIKFYNALDRILNQKWRGTKIELDEDVMIQDGFNDHVAYLIQNKKKADLSRLKSELDKFNATANKKEALKNVNKNVVDLPFLSVAKATGRENLYILRSLYFNYATSIREQKYLVYLLTAKAEAFMFGGGDDDSLKFKTLFMLRKQLEEVEELTDEELEKIKEPTPVVQVSDDTFEPT